MKKYTFLVYHKEYFEFLDKLQEFGVVHVIESNKDAQSPELIDIMHKISDTEKVIRFLKKYDISKLEKPFDLSKVDTDEIIAEVLKKQADLEPSEHKLSGLKKEFAIAEPWGQYSPDRIAELEKYHVEVFLFTCSESKFKTEWQEKYAIEIINKVKGILYLAYFVQKNGDVFDLPLEPHVFPNRSLDKIQVDITLTEDQIQTDKNYFLAAAFDVERMKGYIDYQKSLLDSEKVKLNTLSQADDKLKILEGWVPEDTIEALNGNLDKTQTVYFSTEASAEDKVPIKLKNNKFAKLYEPIGKLFSLPSYVELDLTPFFAPFFMLFFGFCLGDAGYGLLILAFATFFKRKAKADIKPILSLVQWLGGATVVMGLVSGTLFGVNLLDIKGFKLNKFMLDSNQMFNLSLGIGLVQIIFGMCIKAANSIKQKGFKYALSTLGWVFVIVGMILLIALKSTKVISSEIFEILKYTVLGISGFCILVFNDPDANPFISIGKGLYDVYGMVTGVFGDLLSYIRLFALGTSGAILGFVINTVAMQFNGIPYVGWLLFVIFLIIGHSLVIGLSVLGAFVHPMRLTFVEFYKNAGFSGGGKEYKPFKK